MRQVHLPGFTAELSVGVVMHPYFTNGKQTVRNTGMVSPQWSPIFDSVCNQSTGRRTCFRMSWYSGLLYQFDCGPCSIGGFGGPTSFN